MTRDQYMTKITLSGLKISNRYLKDYSYKPASFSLDSRFSIFAIASCNALVRITVIPE